ncbi:hypothetical protein ACUXZZ_00030 [Streptomyces graminifolii]|uniref:hypothetical protein n=1 Tax=Streptomyces graminifolii TaxID=1266771 RepID=UPI0040586746
MNFERFLNAEKHAPVVLLGAGQDVTSRTWCSIAVFRRFRRVPGLRASIAGQVRARKTRSDSELLLEY